MPPPSWKLLFSSFQFSLRVYHLGVSGCCLVCMDGSPGLSGTLVGGQRKEGQEVREFRPWLPLGGHFWLVMAFD